MNRLHSAIQASNGRPVLGAAVYFYDPVFLEIAGLMGARVIWIEMEHAGITFAQAADLCRAAAGARMLSMIRIPDARRESVLKAAECGPDILDLPMADTVEEVEQFVRHARFAPQGNRGYFSVSRALNYGIVDSVPDRQQAINDELSLLVQIESRTAMERIDAISSVPDVDLFIGPADLAASLGFAGQTAHPKVLEAAASIIHAGRRHGKKIVTACAPADFSHWISMGVDVLFITNDIACLKTGMQHALQVAEREIEQKRHDL